MGLAFTLLAGCSSDLGDGVAVTSRSSAKVSDPTISAGSGRAAGAVAVTGADGYPNINVDTARRLDGHVRSQEDQDRLEAELLAIGAQQRAGADAHAPASVIGELQELGRRSKRDAETAIESGEAPTRP